MAVGAKSWLAMSMSGRHEGALPSPRTRKAREVAMEKAQANALPSTFAPKKATAASPPLSPPPEPSSPSCRTNVARNRHLLST